MRRIREVLRLHFDCELSNEKVASALKTSKGSVFNILNRFRDSGLSWPVPAELSDRDIQERLYAASTPAVLEHTPDYSLIEAELRRPRVTLQLLWEEYLAQHPHGLSPASFYRGYKEYCGLGAVRMKQVHKAGDKLFVDYSGEKLSYIDPRDTTRKHVELFVCCWGASSYSYAEATASQNQEEFVASHLRALGFFGCAPQALVPDNLKSAVIKASTYEPSSGCRLLLRITSTACLLFGPICSA